MDHNRMQQLAGIIPSRPGLSESEVGKIIGQQMGGPGRLRAMLGAKQLVLLPNGLKIRWPNKERSRGNVVVITLRPDDTYDMEFFNNEKSVKKYEGIYNDQLVDTFEKQTGWRLTLNPSMEAHDEPDEPEEDDITTSDHRRWYQSGKLYFTGDEKGLKKKMAKDKFWPNVWFISDHGNAHLVSLESLETKLDELRALLGEGKKKAVKKEADCECKCEGEECECECAEEVRAEDLIGEEDAPLGFKGKPMKVLIRKVEKDTQGAGLQFVFAGRVYDEYAKDYLHSVAPGLERSTDILLKNGYTEDEVAAVYKDVRSGPVELSKPVKIKTTVFVREDCNEGAREFSDEQVSVILLAEDTPDLVRHCVSAVGKKYEGDVKKAFAICTAQLQKSGHLKPGSMELTAAGKAKEKEHDAEKGASTKFGDYEKMLAKARAEGVQGYSLPFYARTKTSDGEQWFRATGNLKNGGFSGMMLDAGAAGRSSSKAKTATLDGKWAKQSWDEVDADKVPPKVKAALGEDVEDCCDEDPMEALLDSVRGIVEGQTYAKAQADIMAGLEKDGWKVKKTGPDGKPMKVPHATSPNGDFKLFFKAQAIYKTHGQGDLGNARSLHLPDIRKSTYADFGAALGRWTGQDTKGNPIAKAKSEGAEMRRLSGIDRYSDRVLSEKAPVPRSMTAMVGEIRKYATGSLHPDWVVADEAAVALEDGKGFQCMECGKKFKSVKAAENAQQNGCPKCGGTDIDLAEDVELDETKPNVRFFVTKGAHDWIGGGHEDLKSAIAVAKKKGGDTVIKRTYVRGDQEDEQVWSADEQDEDRTDLWHPDKDVKNPGLPMDKDKAKSAAPADKGSALLKALKCPPGKEAKLVFGRPSRAPVAKN
jgi:hypothetical protein